MDTQSDPRISVIFSNTHLRSKSLARVFALLPSHWAVVIAQDVQRPMTHRLETGPCPPPVLLPNEFWHAQAGLSDALLVLSDDAAIAIPTEGSVMAAIETGNIGVFRLRKLADSEAYGPESYLRPDHILGPALIPSNCAAAIPFLDQLSIDRWFAHGVVLSAKALSIGVTVLNTSRATLPSIAQLKGSDLNLGRFLSMPILQLASRLCPQLGLERSWIDSIDRTVESIRALPTTTSPNDAPQIRQQKDFVDQQLWLLSSFLLADLGQEPPAKPVALPQIQGKPVGFIKMDGIGDFIATLPLLDRLWLGKPSEIRLITLEGMGDLLISDHRITKIMFVPDEYKYSISNTSTALDQLEENIDGVVEFLRDVEIIVYPRQFPDYSLARYLAVLGGPQYQIGNPDRSETRFGNILFERTFTHPLSFPDFPHEATAALRIGDVLGLQPIACRPTIVVDPGARKFVETRWGAYLTEAPRVVVAIGAAYKHRRWPVEYYAAVVSDLSTRLSATFFVVGGEDVAEDGARIADAAGECGADLCGRLKLRETVALMSLANLYIGNDTGMMHVAAALDVAVVAVSCHPVGASPAHANSPRRYGPICTWSRILRPSTPAGAECKEGCTATFPHCIKGVEPMSVVAATLEYLEAMGQTKMSH